MQNMPICSKYRQARASSLQQHGLQQQHSCVFILMFFGCQRLWVFSGCQGRQVGRLGPEGAREEAPSRCLELPWCWQCRAVPMAPSHAQANPLKPDLDQTSYLRVFCRAASSDSSMKIIFFCLHREILWATRSQCSHWLQQDVKDQTLFCCLTSFL